MNHISSFKSRSTRFDGNLRRIRFGDAIVSLSSNRFQQFSADLYFKINNENDEILIVAVNLNINGNYNILIKQVFRLLIDFITLLSHNCYLSSLPIYRAIRITHFGRQHIDTFLFHYFHASHRFQYIVFFFCMVS